MDETVPVDHAPGFARPSSLADALESMASGRSTALAGGTDFYPGLRDRPPAHPLMDLTAIAELRGIRRDGAHWHIGALATWSDVVSADLPPAFDALKQAGREVGSIQIQNRATIAGNLCNASPAADGVPPLLALDASVVIRSRSRARTLRLDSFILGNRRTALAPDELVTAIQVPAEAAAGRSCFLKLGSRRYLVISIAMVAARLTVDATGRIAGAAVAVGACSEVATRLAAIENRLIGRPADALPPVTPSCLGALAPIDDIRAPAEYRRDAAATLVDRALRRCLAPNAGS